MNICVIGGGNIGTLLAAELSTKSNVSVTLYTSKPELWSNDIIIYDTRNNIEVKGVVNNITNSLSEAVSNADMILIAVPSFVIKDLIGDLYNYVKEGTYIGFIPGKGGIEFHFKKLLEKNCICFGAQRVHSIARLKEYGKSVYMTGRKKNIYIASIPSNKCSDVCCILENLLDMEVMPLNNYLEVTLTPSNPILHTSRLYTMFKDIKPNERMEKRILFYEEWDQSSSKTLLECDKELQRICSRLYPLNLEHVQSLAEYYESPNVEAMTKKISNIEAFKNIYSPQIKKGDGYYIDLKSRYFEEDFPYGLCIIKGFAEICCVDVPSIDKVLKWYQDLVGVEYFTSTGFNGCDLINTGIPQNFGFSDMKKVIEYYNM